MRDRTHIVATWVERERPVLDVSPCFAVAAAGDGRALVAPPPPPPGLSSRRVASNYEKRKTPKILGVSHARRAARWLGECAGARWGHEVVRVLGRGEHVLAPGTRRGVAWRAPTFTAQGNVYGRCSNGPPQLCRLSCPGSAKIMRPVTSPVFGRDRN